MIKVSTTLFFNNLIISFKPYVPSPECELICLKSFSTICFSSTIRKSDKISPDFVKASLIPSEPAYDESMVEIIISCKRYSR